MIKVSKLVMPTLIRLDGLEIVVNYLPIDANFGEYDYTEKHITISTTRHTSKDQALSTLFHEMIHAILDHTGLKHLCVDISEGFEETLVTAIENYFKDTLSWDKAAWIETKPIEFKFRSTDVH